MPKRTFNEKGYALIAVLVFVTVAVLIGSAALILNNIAFQSTTARHMHTQSNIAVESGLEEAVLRLLRNPSYSTGTLNIGNSTTIAVSGPITAKVITIESNVSGLYTKMTVLGHFTNNNFIIDSRTYTN